MGSLSSATRGQGLTSVRLAAGHRAALWAILEAACWGEGGKAGASAAFLPTGAPWFSASLQASKRLGPCSEQGGMLIWHSHGS